MGQVGGKVEEEFYYKIYNITRKELVESDVKTYRHKKWNVNDILVIITIGTETPVSGQVYMNTMHSIDHVVEIVCKKDTLDSFTVTAFNETVKFLNKQFKLKRCAASSTCP